MQCFKLCRNISGHVHSRLVTYRSSCSYFSSASSGRNKPYPPDVLMVGNPIESSSDESNDKSQPPFSIAGSLSPPDKINLHVLTENAEIKHKTEGVVPGKGPPPEAPACCCMSGCPSCVWLEYAGEMARYYEDGGEGAKRAIEQMDDENMKAFLLMELKDVLKQRQTS